MSMEAEDMVEEIVPYLGLDQTYLVPFSCGGALDAPQLAARGCAAAVSLCVNPLALYHDRAQEQVAL